MFKRVSFTVELPLQHSLQYSSDSFPLSCDTLYLLRLLHGHRFAAAATPKRTGSMSKQRLIQMSSCVPSLQVTNNKTIINEKYQYMKIGQI